jgi:uncharacterized membrane-anchored protein
VGRRLGAKMIQTRKVVLIALLIPIIGLLALTITKKIILSDGREFEFVIEGYDPRDLLAGHYLQFRVIYGTRGICENIQGEIESSRQVKHLDAYICLIPEKKFSFEKPTTCDYFVSGVCEYNRFVAGLERFYIPQEKAYDLENKIRIHKASIIVSVLKNGKAQIKDLLFDGKSWNSEP